MTQSEVVQLFEEYRALHRDDRDGGYAFIDDLVKARDRMPETVRDLFDRLLADLVIAGSDLRLDALWVLSSSNRYGRHRVKDGVFSLIAEWLRKSPVEIGEDERWKIIHSLLWGGYKGAIDLYTEFLSWQEKADPVQSLHTLSHLCALTNAVNYKLSFAQKLCWYVGQRSPNSDYIFTLFFHIICHHGSLEICEDILRLARQICQPSEFGLLLSYLQRESDRRLSGTIILRDKEQIEQLHRFVSLLRSLQHDTHRDREQNSSLGTCG